MTYHIILLGLVERSRNTPAASVTARDVTYGMIWYRLGKSGPGVDNLLAGSFWKMFAIKHNFGILNDVGLAAVSFSLEQNVWGE
ncbi:hypothetical protein HBH79_249810 [Parastagonospora nodorum]|nr:hypothetical protein HBH79_249810 [Parastagonospora nodorum]